MSKRMLFVVEYELTWEMLDAAIAKRLEWDEVQPDDFRMLGEYVWQEGDPPFRGVAIVEADQLASVHAFALHYGPAVRLKVRPATDVVSALRFARGRHREAKVGADVRPQRRRVRNGRARS